MDILVSVASDLEATSIFEETKLETKTDNIKADITKVEAIVEGDQKEEHSSQESVSNDESPGPLMEKSRAGSPLKDVDNNINLKKIPDLGKAIPTVRSISQNSSLSISDPTVTMRQSQIEKKNSARPSTNQQKYKSIPTSN